MYIYIYVCVWSTLVKSDDNVCGVKFIVNIYGARVCIAFVLYAKLILIKIETLRGGSTNSVREYYDIGERLSFWQ